MTYILIAITLLLTNCGSDDGSADQVVANTNRSEEAPDQAEGLQSISLENASDLPACESANKSQLAYVISEESFYVCQDDWLAVDIQGKDGADGQDGIASNSSNLWHDSITGLDWLLGGPGTAWTAEVNCSNGWRAPTSAEGLAAAQHGIRAIANTLGLNMEFWTGVGNDASYIGLTAGVVSIKAGVTSDSRSMFCVKE